QGVWDVTSLEVDGAAMSAAVIAGARIVVEGGRFTTSGMGATYEGVVELDAHATPKTIDLVFDKGPESGNRSLGIYRLDDDAWTICLTSTATKRPTTFATKPGSGLGLETLKRRAAGGKKPHKAAAGAAAPTRSAESSDAPSIQEEIARLEGEWTLVAGE